MSLALLGKPRVFLLPASALQKTRLMPSRGGMCAAFGSCPRFCTRYQPRGYGMRPRGDRAPAGFTELLARVERLSL